MSASNAAAIRRRVHNNPSSAPSTPPSQTKQTGNSNGIPQNQRGLTIQQVISDFDGRIKNLEESAKTVVQIPAESSINPELIDEYNSRFEIIANELADLKNFILKLQTFTMEVNKSLHDDRIHMLSDIEPNNDIKNTVTYELPSVIDNDKPFTDDSKVSTYPVDNVNSEFLVESSNEENEED